MHQSLHGFVEVICGSMFSGKTEELLRRVKRAQIAKQKVQVFKPCVDDRYSIDHVQSHDSSRIPSTVVKSSHEILDYLEDTTRVVGIDEVQFFDEAIVAIADKLAYRGVRVILAGLDMTFTGEPFGPMPKLLAIAENVTKLAAVCTVCGGPATRSQRTAPLKQGVPAQVGGAEAYEARCRFHHERRNLSVPAREMGLPQTLNRANPGLAEPSAV